MNNAKQKLLKEIRNLTSRQVNEIGAVVEGTEFSQVLEEYLKSVPDDLDERIEAAAEFLTEKYECIKRSRFLLDQEYAFKAVVKNLEAGTWSQHD